MCSEMVRRLCKKVFLMSRREAGEVVLPSEVIGDGAKLRQMWRREARDRAILLEQERWILLR